MISKQAVEEMLVELRQTGSDSQTVEAKRARTALPETTWETLSAFANCVGGTLLLGVDEDNGNFTVTGVDDPNRVAADLQAECAELEPPLRPIISTIQLDGGAVIIAEISALPRDQRPCHRRHLGAHDSTFIRVGDADQKLRSVEVDEMLAARSGLDHSRQPAPEGAKLDRAASARFCERRRNESSRQAGMADDQILEAYGVTADSRLTLAGMLTLGVHPEAHSPAARIAARRHPTSTDPPGTRHDGTKIEGTVGELLDGTLDWIRTRLTTVQVLRDGNIVDDTDVPLEVLREIVSNALVHRSFALADTSVLVSVYEYAVVITSPGGLHVSNDPSLLGIGSRNGLRNNTLVRICEQLVTPKGARIIEGQNLGIAHADRASRAADTLPPLFADRPTAFEVVLVRHSIDRAAVRDLVTAAGVELTADQERVLAVVHRLSELGDEAVVAPWLSTPVDARFCARSLAGGSIEDAAVVLRDLEAAGLLTRSRSRTTPTWTLPTHTETRSRRAGRKRTGRVPDVLKAIGNSSAGELRAKEIGEALKLASPTSRNRWIRRAVEDQLIEPTKDSHFDPQAAYRLTAKGRSQLARQEPA